MEGCFRQLGIPRYLATPPSHTSNGKRDGRRCHQSASSSLLVLLLQQDRPRNGRRSVQKTRRHIAGVIGHLQTTSYMSIESSIGLRGVQRCYEKHRCQLQAGNRNCREDHQCHEGVSRDAPLCLTVAYTKRISCTPQFLTASDDASLDIVNNIST